MSTPALLSESLYRVVTSSRTGNQPAGCRLITDMTNDERRDLAVEMAKPSPSAVPGWRAATGTVGWTKKLHVYDAQGRHCAMIDQGANGAGLHSQLTKLAHAPSGWP